jgi:hypothetical protein
LIQCLECIDSFLLPEFAKSYRTLNSQSLWYYMKFKNIQRREFVNKQRHWWFRLSSLKNFRLRMSET